MTTFVKSVAELEKLVEKSVEPLGLDWSTALLGKPNAKVRAMFKELAQSPAAERVRTVSLKNNDLDGPLALSLLVEAPFVSQIERLILRDNCLSTDSMKALASCDRFDALRVLDMSGNYFGEDDIRALAKATWFASLRSLDVGVNWVNAAAVQALVGGGQPLALEHLMLGPCMSLIGDEGAKALASGNLPKLDQLDITNGGIGDQGLAAICENMTTIRFLSLPNKEDVWYADCESQGRNNITDQGAHALASSSMAPNLRECFLAGNQISAHGRQVLQDSLSPECDLYL